MLTGMTPTTATDPKPEPGPMTEHDPMMEHAQQPDPAADSHEAPAAAILAAKIRAEERERILDWLHANGFNLAVDAARSRMPQA